MSLRLITSAPSAPVSDWEYRADLISRWLAADDWAVELRLLAEAVAYDKATPDDDPPLVDELLGTRLGDVAPAA